jgi:phage terminase large subunit
MQQVKVLIPAEFKELFNPKWRNILFYGGRGSGKSHSVARALILKARQNKLRILCTRELQNSIDDSVMQLLKDIIDSYRFTDFRYTNTEIINTVTGSNFIFKGLRKQSSQSVKSLEGIDIAWVEEAQSITEESLDVLSPTVRKGGSQLIFTFNRLTELDPVYVKYIINPPDDTYARMVNYDVAVKHGYFPEVLRKEMEFDKENDPELYEHKWMGEPMSQAEFSVLNRTMIRNAMERRVEDDGAVIIGVDVARMGSDRTVFWMRKGLKTLKFEVHTKLRTTQVCDALEQFVGFNKEIEIKVDDTGVGGGVTDEMMKREYNIKAINFGGAAQDADKYPNWISEAWFHMVEILPGSELPMNIDLLQELSTRQWKQDNKGKRRVESKDDYKKRGFRSPDLADACIICYGAVNEPGMLGFLRERATDHTLSGAISQAIHESATDKNPSTTT